MGSGELGEDVGSGELDEGVGKYFQTEVAVFGGDFNLKIDLAKATIKKPLQLKIARRPNDRVHQFFIRKMEEFYVW